jgi:hypothetical protein
VVQSLANLHPRLKLAGYSMITSTDYPTWKVSALDVVGKVAQQARHFAWVRWLIFAFKFHVSPPSTLVSSLGLRVLVLELVCLVGVALGARLVVRLRGQAHLAHSIAVDVLGVSHPLVVPSFRLM